MSTTPKISIITVVKNGAETIQQCIESVWSQSIDVEHLVLDGASSDGTAEIVSNNSDKITLFISEKDNGIYSAMNKGVQMATGDIVGILNADDFYEDNYVLERVLAAFERKDVEACYGDLAYVDSLNVNRVTRRWFSGSYRPSNFYWGWMPPHPTFFVLRSVYRRFGLFREDMGTAADYELMLRFLLVGQISCNYIPEVLVRMRAGGASNATLMNRIQANRMDRRAWDVNFVKPYPWTLIFKPLRKLGQWVRNGS